MTGLAIIKNRPHVGAGVPQMRKSSSRSAGPSSFCSVRDFGKKGPVVYGSYVDELLAILPASGVVGDRKFVHSNHLYSVAALTDNSGNVVERYRYDAYGQRTVLAADGATVRAASSYGNQYGFTGRYLDKETGLWYFRTRYHSGILGRFISRDTIGYVDGPNLYRAYFAPLQVDPLGGAACESDTFTITKKIDGGNGKFWPLGFIGPIPIKGKLDFSTTYSASATRTKCCCASGKYKYSITSSGTLTGGAEIEVGVQGGGSFAGASIEAFAGAFVSANISLTGSGTLEKDECGDNRWTGTLAFQGTLSGEGGIRGRVSATYDLLNIAVTGVLQGSVSVAATSDVHVTIDGSQATWDWSTTPAGTAQVNASFGVSWGIWTTSYSWQAQGSLSSGAIPTVFRTANPFD